jgi:hypothetical protein
MSSMKAAALLTLILCSLGFSDEIIHDDWAWVHGIASTQNAYALTMAADNQDNVWVGGVIHHDTLVIGDDTLVGSGSCLGYLAKYDGVTGDPITALRIEGARAFV